MSYFRELPDLEYQSPITDKISSTDYVRVKNIFRRVKLRDDLGKNVVIFNKYQIEEGERPEIVAEKLYDKDANSFNTYAINFICAWKGYASTNTHR